MGMFNRIVNILVLVLAILAVIFSAILFQKREELRGRGDKMADVINTVAKVLDKNSKTAYANDLIPKVSKEDLNPKKNAKAGEIVKKTLDHKNYANLETVLAPFKKQAAELIEQRDALGTALNETAESLEIPETFGAAAFQEIPSYSEKKTQLVSLVKKVNERDDAIIRQIVASGSAMGFTLDKTALKNLENFRTPLNEFGSKVEKLKKRSDGYAEHITKVCKIFGVPNPSLGGDDYNSELSTAETAMKGVKDEFERTKENLKITQNNLKKAQDDLSQAETKIASLEKNTEDREKQISALKLENRKLKGEDVGDETPEAVPTDEALVRKLEGKIVEVSDKWDFVMIDLGKKSKIAVGEGKKKKEIPVSLPENRVMVVGRGDNYVAKIKIMCVNDNCAIADILPDLRNGNVEVGDRVFFVQEPPSAQAATAPSHEPVLKTAPSL